jgi:periplasmic divalent cation tolerance protein
MIQQQLIMVETTVASEPVARRMAAVLIEKKVAACVNVEGPIESHYAWKGTVKADKEFIVRAKTTQARLLDCIEAIKKEHPYELPSILALPVIGANKPYADWVSEFVKK